jgi:tetrapyrrole methylase family protein/MazG family protein
MSDHSNQHAFKLTPQLEQALGLDPADGLFIISAEKLSRLHLPPFPPSIPALVGRLAGADLANIQACLLGVYPPAHRLHLARRGTGDVVDVEEFALENLAALSAPERVEALLIPPLGVEAAFEGFQEVVARLRAPDGCPWDREQTHESLRTNLLEETYETLEAIDRNDATAMTEEFGDLLLQIILHAQIASEAGEYNMAEVLRGIHTKIVRRHPHVFGEVHVDGVKGVLQNWERLKEEERKNNGTAHTKGLLDGVPNVFPSLAQSQELQDRAARVGFDWKSVQGVMDKVLEEIEEVRSAPDASALSDEIGDLLFAVVNLARWNKVDAESALRQTNARFRRRFAHIEAAARQRGISTADLSFDELNRLWDEAKASESNM